MLRMGRRSQETDLEAESPPPLGAALNRTSERSRAACGLIESLYQESQKARTPLEPDWALALAYEAGHQWMEYDLQTGLKDSRTAKDKRFYRKANMIRPLRAVAVARIISNRPDVTIKARSRSELDRQAKKDLELAVAHYNTKYNFRRTLARCASYAWLSTTALLYQWWDPKALAEVPVEWDEQGDPTRFIEAPVGDYCEKFVPGHEVYLDPRAIDWESARWAIHVQMLPLAEIEEKWGVKVHEETRQGRGFFGLVDAFVSPWLKGSSQARNMSCVKTLYERSSPKYRKGRVIRVCGDVLLEYREVLPYDRLPFLPLGFSTVEGTAYHRGAGCDLHPLQFDYNMMRSRWFESIKQACKPTQVRQWGDGGGADQADERVRESNNGIDETPALRTVWYKRGFNPPTWLPPAPIPAGDLVLCMKEIREEMREIANVHRVSSGMGDPNASSAIAMRVLQDSDESAGTEFQQSMEWFLEERARRMQDILADYVREDRAWQLNGRKNAEEAQQTYSGLEALRRGGRAAVIVIEGSGTDRTPEAEDRQILDLASSNHLGDTAEPDVREMILSLLNSSAAGRVLEAVLDRKEAATQEAVVRGQVSDEIDALDESGALGLSGGLPQQSAGLPEQAAGLPQQIGGMAR